MRKQYIIPQVEILDMQSSALMIPGSDPSDPHPHPAPRRLWRPGPGASYCPPAKIV